MKQCTIAKMMLPLAFLLFFTWSAAAQNDQTPAGPPTKEIIQEHAKRMAEKLGLTPEQTAELATVETSFFEKAHSLRESMREAEKAKMDELHLAREASIKKLLSGEQFAQYQKLAEAHRQQHPPHPPHPPHPHGGN